LSREICQLGRRRGHIIEGAPVTQLQTGGLTQSLPFPYRDFTERSYRGGIAARLFDGADVRPGFGKGGELMAEETLNESYRVTWRNGQLGWPGSFGLAVVLSVGLLAAVLLTFLPGASPSPAFATTGGTPTQASTTEELPGTTPLAAPDIATVIPEGDTRQTDRALLNTAVICLTVTAVLGFLLTVRNRRRQDSVDEWLEQDDESHHYRPPRFRHHDARDAHDAHDAHRDEINHGMPAH
jgi:hypothetical protein